MRGETTITIFGRRAVLEALGAESVEIERVLVDRSTPTPFRKDLKAACRDPGSGEPTVELIEADRREVVSLSGDARNDQGVAAVIRLKGVTEADEFVETLKGSRAKQPTRLIALDNVTNPQNVGMIVRSALASGMSGILWPTVGAPWVSGLIIKASAATVYRIPIVRCGALVEGLWTLRKHGFAIVGLDAASPQSLFDLEPAHRACYIVGAESTGLTDEVADQLDQRVSIPMAGDVESLNVAVAAALVCFHVARA
jgi:23S rRNA (guanosine2251-2'-O)-methyltransferase